MNQKPGFNPDTDTRPERIAKRIARAGICSRRDAEVRIRDGRVAVNGEIIDSPALNVYPSDIVSVDNKQLPEREPARLWRYCKPRGLVVSARDEKNRVTIFDKLPSHLPRVITVGRLDLDSEGLLLLTNDGDLARYLELPSTGWSRKYRVRVHGHVNEEQLASLAKGVTIDGITFGQVTAKLDRQMASNAWLTMAIREGKNREIRRIMEYLGHQVSRLIRVSYGPFQLSNLSDGEVEEIRPRIVFDQLGLAPPGPNDKQTTLTTSERGEHAHHSRKPPRRKINKIRRR